MTNYHAKWDETASPYLFKRKNISLKTRVILLFSHFPSYVAGACTNIPFFYESGWL